MVSTHELYAEDRNVYAYRCPKCGRSTTPLDGVQGVPQSARPLRSRVSPISRRCPWAGPAAC